MSLSEWLIDRRNISLKKNLKQNSLQVPEGLWIKCDQCGSLMYYKTLNKNLKLAESQVYEIQEFTRDIPDRVLKAWELLLSGVLRPLLQTDLSPTLTAAERRSNSLQLDGNLRREQCPQKAALKHNTRHETRRANHRARSSAHA